MEWDSESTSTLRLDPTLPFQIVYVSGNEGKLKELQTFLGDAMARHFVFYDVDLDEIQGDEAAVVTDKVQRAKEEIERALDGRGRALIQRSTVYVLVEDTSFYLTQYSADFHFPGTFCKFLVKAKGCNGFIDMVKGHDDRSCTAQATYGLLQLGQVQDNEPVLFCGECEGVIADEPRGDTLFGWDAVFQYKGSKQTFAEMAVEEKNRISHRAEAMRKLSGFIQSLMNHQGPDMNDVKQ